MWRERERERRRKKRKRRRGKEQEGEEGKKVGEDEKVGKERWGELRKLQAGGSWLSEHQRHLEDLFKHIAGPYSRASDSVAQEQDPIGCAFPSPQVMLILMMSLAAHLESHSSRSSHQPSAILLAVPYRV